MVLSLKNLFCILILLSLLQGTHLLLTGFSALYWFENVTDHKETANLASVNLVPSQSLQRISINGNEDFLTKAAQQGWPGDGSDKYPYLIKQLKLDAFTTLISIRNTNVFFRVLDIFLFGANDALIFDNVSNAQVVNNTIQNCIGNAIVIRNSHGVYISNNRIIRNLQLGFFVENSVNITIINNTLLDNGGGISLFACNYSLVSTNKILDNEGPALSVENCDFCSITGNKLKRNNGDGISLESSVNCTISSNTVIETTDGIYLTDCPYTDVYSNKITNYTRGLFLSESSNCQIYSNKFDHGGLYGLWVFEVENSLISSNVILDNYLEGLYLYACDNNSIVWNDFIDNHFGSDQCIELGHTGNSNLFAKNHWSDWTSPDDDADGIVDLSYNITGNSNFQDLSPRVISGDYMSNWSVILPYGGETIENDLYIIWEPLDSTVDDFSYSVFYSSNGGYSWKKLESNLLVSSYFWDVSDHPQTSHYLVKIVAQSPQGCIKVVISDSKFTIHHPLTPPTIITPRASVQQGVISILWNQVYDSGNHSLFYSVYFSNDSGDNWYLIESYLYTSYFSWNTTYRVKDGNDFLIKVEAICFEGQRISAVSEQFAIDNHRVIDFKIISPMNGSVFQETLLVNWTASRDSLGYEITYTIYYSADNGKSWNKITQNLTETSYLWDVSDIETGSEFKILIEAHGGEGESNTVVSDGTFTIRNIPRFPIEFVILLSIGLFLVTGIVGGIFILRKKGFSSTGVYMSSENLQDFTIGACIGSFSDTGLIIRSKSSNCPFEDHDLHSMLEYSAVLYQRGEIETMYGPFPHTQSERKSSEKDFFFVSFGLEVIDESIHDSRVIHEGGYVPAIVLLFYPKKFDSLFITKKNEIIDYLKSTGNKISQITECNGEFLTGIERGILNIMSPLKTSKPLDNF